MYPLYLIQQNFYKLLKEFDAIHRGLRLGGSVGAAQEIVNLIQTS